MSIISSRNIVLALLAAVLLATGSAVQDHLVGDLFVTRTLQEVEFAPWVETMVAVSFIGGALPLIAIALATIAWFLWKKRTAESVIVVAGLLSLATAPLLKFLVDRPRPTADLVTVWGGYENMSFPSGHALSAVVVFGLLAYLAPHLLPWRRVVTIVRVSLVFLIILIGVSRVYLGAHWASDVLGGYLYGGLLLALLIYLHRLQTSGGSYPRVASSVVTSLRALAAPLALMGMAVAVLLIPSLTSLEKEYEKRGQIVEIQDGSFTLRSDNRFFKVITSDRTEFEFKRPGDSLESLKERGAIVEVDGRRQAHGTIVAWEVET